MLARLDEIAGVSESRVDWTGKKFLLALEPGIDRERVTVAAVEVLGAGAQVLDEDETRGVVASYRKGEEWMKAGETLRLSRFEAGVIARRYAGEAAQELGLGTEATGKLLAVFEREIERAFERTHAAGGIQALASEIEVAGERILEDSRAFLAPAELAKLEDCLRRFAAR